MDPIGFVKVGVVKWASVFEGAALTIGSLKMRDRLIFSTLLLLKEILHIFLGELFFLTEAVG